MKKLLRIFAMISGLIGVIMVLLGVIALFNNRIFIGHSWVNYFYAAQTFLFAGVFLLFASRECLIGE